MNDPFVKKFDINKSKILGKRYDEAFNFLHCKKDSLKNKTCFIEQRLKENKRVEFEENYTDKYYTIIGTTILDRNKKIQSYVISYNDITEMKKQNKKLKKLDELKSNFLNVTSHELRTPMSSIKGYVQMMLKNMLGTINDEQSKALNVILRNTNRLDNLIQDILDISRLESGSMKFIAEKTNIKEMLTEIGETMSLAASEKNISLQINASDDLPIILIDQYRIKQVIMNLINNSIKFSAENTTITVKGFVEDDKTIIQVIDQGRGIPKEKQENVFDTFYQVDGGMDRKFGGAGLGLAISRGIILTHGGNIWVESSGIPGDGTTFSFSIPNKSVKNLEEQFKKLDMFKLEVS
jgi:signal transduction histidine kinase